MNIITADRVVTGTADLADGWVAIEGSHIVAVGTGQAPDAPAERIDGWLIPGFVDLHVHGGGNASFSDGDAATVAAFHRGHGTTTMLASLVSETLDDLEVQIARLVPHLESGAIAGIHLEGPFLAEHRKGAHSADVLRAPHPGDVTRLLNVAPGAIRMVTLAPELDDALDAIGILARAGVLVALGHSDADALTARRGVDAGARIVTHLFNGMAPLHHRAPGLADVGLLDPRLMCELILDTHHLSDEITEIALRLLGERYIAITDAMAAAGAPDGRFMLGTLPVEARDGIVRVIAGGSLAGSTLTMDRAFANLIGRFGRAPLDAVQATSTRPAGLLGRTDIGRIQEGARADLIVWQGDHLARVMRDGAWIA